MSLFLHGFGWNVKIKEFLLCIEGILMYRSNKVASILDLYEYKATNLLFGLVDLVNCCILQFLVHFVGNLGVE